MTEPPKVWVLEQFYRAVLLPHPSRKYLSCTLKEKEIYFLILKLLNFGGYYSIIVLIYGLLKRRDSSMIMEWYQNVCEAREFSQRKG